MMLLVGSRAALLSLFVAGCLYAILAQAPPTASSQQAQADESSCQSQAERTASIAANPLEAPEIEDDLTEPLLPEVPAAPTQQRANPNTGLKPVVRAPTSMAGAAAAADSRTPAVYLGSVRWCVIQPVRNPTGSAPKYRWDAYEEVFDRFRAAGVPIESVKIVDAPNWAVEPACKRLAQDRPAQVKRCPPQLAYDQDLREFAAAFASRYGSNSVYGIKRLSFWNEPNTSGNWGELKFDDNQERREAARQYSKLLTSFESGAKGGDAAISVDAGEVAAGSRASDGNGAGYWADFFTSYNHDTYPKPAGQGGGDRNYDRLAIHAYSQDPEQVRGKIRNYSALAGTPTVSVTEFGWSVTSRPQRDQVYKCVSSGGAQSTKFKDAVNMVQSGDVRTPALVYFSLMDGTKTDPKCFEDAAYPGLEPSLSTYGLYRRDANGGTSNPTGRPRPIRDEFIRQLGLQP